MPATLQDILRCKDPTVRARVTAPPCKVAVTVRALHTCVRVRGSNCSQERAELEGMVWQRLILFLADGCARMPATLQDILRRVETQCVHEHYCAAPR